MNDRLPAFVGIGAQKAGTTWTYEQLRGHPQLFLPETKELNFFYQSRPESWYRQQFAHASEGRVCGEISPNYFSQPGVAERMHALIPRARLFCILREPAARAFSQWKMARQRGNIPSEVSFIDAFRQNLRWMAEQGDYPARIREFTRWFPAPEQMQILFYDDLESDPGGFLEALFAYLGVRSTHDPSRLCERIGASAEKSTVPAEHREVLSNYYRESVRRLEEMTGRDLSHWLP